MPTNRTPLAVYVFTAGIRQTELARAVDYQFQQVHRVVTGKGRPGRRLAKALARELGPEGTAALIATWPEVATWVGGIEAEGVAA